VGQDRLDQKHLVHEVAREHVEHRLGREIRDAVEGADALVDRVVEEQVDPAPLREHGRG
jgi:hypothetical protein